MKAFGAALFPEFLLRGNWLSQNLKIELTGRDGSYWCLSGPGSGAQGVILKPRVSQLIDTPVKTLYVPGPFGEEYAGKRVQRREMVFTVQIGSEDMAPDQWSGKDAAWRWAWDYDDECVMTVTVLNDNGTVDTERFIKLRLLEEPKSYGEKDPFIWSDNEIVMTVTATFPYWQAPPVDYEWQLTSGTSGTKTFTDVRNYGDVPVWFRWALSAPGVWTLPDYSWGNPMYSRAQQDANRTVVLPNLPAGAHASVDSDPRVQTIVCLNEYPAQWQWKGRDLLYPLMPGRGGSVTLSVTGATGGAAAILTVPRWYSRPWSKPVSL